MRRKALAIGLLVLLAVPSASATFRREPDDLAHAGWSMAFFASRAELENITFRIKPGFHANYAVPVHNNGTTPITNVTLVVWFTEGVADWRVGATFGADPPGEVYASWPEVKPSSFQAVALDMTASEEEGPFAGELLLLFERDGVPSYARTKLHGAIEEQGPTAWLPSASSGPGLVVGAFLLAALAGMVGFLVGRARRR